MNWLLKRLGYRDSKYHGSTFSVAIRSTRREGVRVIYTCQTGSFDLVGERIGRHWEGIAVRIPTEFEAAQVAQIVHDIEIAFEAMQYQYVIERSAGIEVLSETQRRAAVAELNELGYEIELLPDRTMRLTTSTSEQRQKFKGSRNLSPRIISLLRDMQGTRQRFEILGKSKES